MDDQLHNALMQQALVDRIVRRPYIVIDRRTSQRWELADKYFPIARVITLDVRM